MKSWYDELDFAENPFTIKPRQDLQEYIGHTQTINQILKHIQQKKVVIIKGEFGTGKTSILKSIISEHKGNRKIFYYNAFKTKKDIDTQKISKNAGGYLSKKLGLKTKDIILLVDEAHVLSQKSFQEIKKAYKKIFKSIIFVTSEIKYEFPEIIQKLKPKKFELKKFSEQNALQIVSNRLNGETDILPDVVVKKIYSESKTPREFLQKCEDACITALQKGKMKVTIKDL